MTLETLIARQLPQSVKLRRNLHQIPELGFQEYETAAAIRDELNRLGIAHVDGVTGAPTATVAWLGDIHKPCIALRADIDALPIEERTGVDYASKHPGMMHACGHDGHTATLLGVGAILKAIESTLPVCVKLLWQPAEEGGGGGERMVEAGVLDGRIGPKVDAIFGLHGWPGLKIGLVASKPGALLAATDNFIATFIGRGCHGAFPHLGRDPIVCAAEAVLSLQQVVSREFDPIEPAVVTVGKFNAGTAVNVIPDTATIEATVRTLTTPSRKKIAALVDRRLAGIAAAHDCKVETQWVEGYPATINDPAMYDYVAKIARQTFGPERFFQVGSPSMGGEDFAYYLEKVPGCFFLVGVEPMDAANYPPLHSDRYDFSDGAMAVGMRLFMELVLNWGK
jgi:amidohydrolase